jgi:hypothetical protein
MIAVAGLRGRMQAGSDENRHLLLPMRVNSDIGTLFEGAALEMSESAVYFRTPNWDSLREGERVIVEVTIPPELSGDTYVLRVTRGATVTRIDTRTLSSVLGCRPRTCGVLLMFDSEGAAPADTVLEPLEAALVVA